MTQLKKFPSDLLLKMRRRREMVAAKRFAKSAGHVGQASTRLAKLHRALQMHQRAMDSLAAEGGDPLNLCMYRQCLTDIHAAIGEEKSRLRLASCEAGDRRGELLDAMNRRKAVEPRKDSPMRATGT